LPQYIADVRSEVFTAVFMKIRVFWDVILCHKQIVTDVSKGHTAFIFRVSDPED
jgi:hypothetical protein